VLSQGPDRARSRQDALSDGLNCISLAHLIIRDLFGYVLPATYQCTELSTDQEHFMSIPSASLMRPGDLVWFGVADPATTIADFVPSFENGRLANFSEYPINHVAIYTGVYDHGDYLLIHANQVDQTNTVWPLKAFQGRDRYRKVYAIMRLRPQYARRSTGAR
jgi:cell wall-associated NlpC family hydrolase